jgi:endogenous inhibitor of DNA gyrase (YacG/DUF329 family)
MTNEQRKKIKMLRYQGLGYKKIADEVGLSRDSVRGYCLRSGLGGCGIELVADYHDVMQDEFLHILCLNCGLEIKQNEIGRKKKYCSISCKNEWEKIHRKSYTLACEYCGKEFKSLGVNGRKFCSQDCYQKDRFWREEDVAEVAKKILEFKRINHLPKWLKDLLLASTEE